MPPQPLSRVNSTVNQFEIGAAALLKRPMLAAKVMTVIGVWSDIDTCVAAIFASAIKTKEVFAHEILQSVQSEAAKNDLIKKALEKSLSKENFDLFLALRKAAKSAKATRHRFAHHIWLHSDEMPDCLLLVDSREQSSWWAKAIQFMSDPSSMSEFITDRQMHPLDWNREKIFVYRDADLNEACSTAFELNKAFTSLKALVCFPLPSETAEEIRSGLLQSPLVQSVNAPKKASSPD